MRRSTWRLGWCLCALAALAAAASGSRSRASDDAGRLPAVMLWAWEQPQDLSFIDPDRVGVAFLERTVAVAPDPSDATRPARVAVQPRMQPIRVPPRTALVAVVRVEAPAGAAQLTDVVRARTLEAVLGATHFPGLAGIQVDFDAARSQRPFYRALLADLDRALPDSLYFSMTALASWCEGDPWLEGVATDEVVPMVFRMGADDHRVRRALARGDFASAPCRTSLGIATDEPAPPLRRGRRLYVFHAGRWSARAAHEALARVRP